MGWPTAYGCTFCGACFAGIPLLSVNTGCPNCGGQLEPLEEQEAPA